VLTAAGLPDVRILDGGLAAWTGAGGGLETGSATIETGDITVAQPDLYTGARQTLTAEQISDVAALLDARAPERYRGDVEPVDPVAGHIPGATNLPSTALLADDGTFLDNATIASLLADRGVATGESLGVYCGSGVTASVVLAALNAAGIDAALFPGSWSQWSSEPGRPVARG
jgi:thiosulfate/3-mercaptopyruvate sulfurtransferase